MLIYQKKIRNSIFFYFIDNPQKRLIPPKKETIIINKMNFWQLIKEFNHIDMINDGGKKTISL